MAFGYINVECGIEEEKNPFPLNKKRYYLEHRKSGTRWKNV